MSILQSKIDKGTANLTNTDYSSIARSATGRAISNALNGFGLFGLTLTPEVLKKVPTTPTGIAAIGIGVFYAGVSGYYKAKSKFRFKNKQQQKELDEKLLFYQEKFENYDWKTLPAETQASIINLWNAIRAIDNPVVRCATQGVFIETLAEILESPTVDVQVLTENLATIKNEACSIAKALLIAEALEKLAENTKKSKKPSSKLTAEDYEKLAYNWDKLTQEGLASVKRSTAGAFFNWALGTFGVAGYQIISVSHGLAGTAAHAIPLFTHPVGLAWLGGSLLTGIIGARAKFKSKQRLKLIEREKQLSLQLDMQQYEYQRLLESWNNKEQIISFNETWNKILTVPHRGFRAKLQLDFNKAILAIKKNPSVAAIEEINKFLDSDKYKSVLNNYRYQDTIAAEWKDKYKDNKEFIKNINAIWQFILKNYSGDERIKWQNEYLGFINQIKSNQVYTLADLHENLVNLDLYKELSNKGFKMPLLFSSNIPKPAETIPASADNLTWSETRSAFRSAFGRGVTWFMTGVALPGVALDSLASLTKLFKTPTGGFIFGLGLVAGGVSATLKYISKRKAKFALRAEKFQEDLIVCSDEFARLLQISPKETQENLNEHWLSISTIDDPEKRYKHQKIFTDKLNLAHAKIICENSTEAVTLIDTVISECKNKELQADLDELKDITNPVVFTQTDYINYANNWKQLTSDEKASIKRSGIGAFFNYGTLAFSIGGLTLAKLTLGVVGFTAGAALLTHPIGWGLIIAAVAVGGVAYAIKAHSRAKVKLKEREEVTLKELETNDCEYKRVIRVKWKNDSKKELIKDAEALWKQISQVPHQGLRSKLQKDLTVILAEVKNKPSFSKEEFSKKTSEITSLFKSTEYANLLLKLREEKNIKLFQETYNNIWSVSNRIKNVWTKTKNLFGAKAEVNWQLTSDVSNKVKYIWQQINSHPNIESRVARQEEFIKFIHNWKSKNELNCKIVEMERDVVKGSYAGLSKQLGPAVPDNDKEEPVVNAGEKSHSNNISRKSVEIPKLKASASNDNLIPVGSVSSIDTSNMPRPAF